MKKTKQVGKGVLLSTSYAATMLLSMFLGYKAGVYFDERTGASPIFLIIGLLAGVILGLYSVVQEILHFHDMLNKDRK